MPNRSIPRWAQGCVLVLLLVVVVVSAFHPSPAKAVIPVTDINLGTITLSQKIQFYFWRIQDFLRAKIQKAFITASTIAFKHSLRVFATKLAEDTADWVGNWGTGKKPLFIEDKKYFSKLSDAAAGEFLDTFAISVFGQSVCEPINIEKKLTIIGTIEGLTQGNRSGEACQRGCETRSTARQVRINLIQQDVFAVEAVSKENPNTLLKCPAHLRQPGLDETNLNNWEYGEPNTNKPAGECATIVNALLLKEKARDVNELQKCLRDCQQGRKKASCSKQEAIKNLSEARVAAQVSLSYQQGQNDIGQIIKLYGETRAKQNEAVQEQETILRGGFKAVTTKVTNQPTIPPDLVRKRAEIALEEAAIAEKTYTGTLAADIISIFTNTVIGRWTERIFKGKCGLNPAWCKGPQQAQTFAGQEYINTAAGRQTFASLGQIDYIAGDSSRTEDIFQAMRSRGLTVDDRLTQAVREKKSVQEALDAGLLDGQKTFGYDSQGNEPQDGYPYRLIQYLKHYRVVPVGWELAAQYMKKFDNRNIGLTELTRLYGQCDPDNPSPYCGLIDPNWVLKAPETFCKRRGSGEEIVTRQFVCDQDTEPFNGANLQQGEPKCGPSSTGAPPDIGKWMIQHNTDYCADEQSCIAENEDGSCRAFGYCFAEKRVWRFDGTACPNYYASCTAFTSQDGLDVSYLTNTVNKEGCSSGNAGCRWYCAVPEPDGTWGCSVNGGVKQHFDRDAEKCPASAEGCTEYLGVKNGTNLAKNASFEDFDGTRDDAAPPNDTFPGWSVTPPGSIRAIGSDNDLPGITNLTALALNGGDLLMKSPLPLFSPPHLTFEPLVYRSFTLSYYAKTTGPVCTGDATLDVGGTSVKIENQNYGPAWERHLVVGDPVPPPPPPSIEVNVTIGTPTCEIIIDNVQLEEANGPSTYKDYGSVNALYLNSNRLACSADEIGCEFYTPTDGSQRVPGVATQADTCDATNVGCRAFREMPIDTIPTRPVDDPVYLVPSTGRSCSAAAVGCEEYTNLDAQARGGEAREYYTRIKQCVRPKAGDPEQQTFFSWVGSDTRGYELRSYRMLKSNSNNALIQNGPCTNLSVGTLGSDPQCEDFAPAPPAFCNALDVGTNPDCTEFFNGGGNVFYLLRSRTINVLDDCFPARNSVDQAAGLGTIYMISPGESYRCSAVEANCREYKGNAGNNVRLAFRDTFEGGATANWDVGAISSEATSVGGHSMDVTAPGVELKSSVVVPQLTQGKSYILSFWAKPKAGAPTILARFRSPGSPPVDFPSSATLTNDWNRYSLGPVYFNRAVAPNDVLFINVSADVYLDNIELREVTDSAYLIKDTARSCPDTQANCSIYRDRQNNNHFLKSFTRLCGEEKVGCIELIDTKNSASPFSTTVKGVVTGYDEVRSFVANSNALCQAEEKGCQAFGKPTIDVANTVTDWETVYLKNNPDRYETILCTASEDMCSEYASKLDGAKSYFRDPGSTVCSFERPPQLALCADTVTACTNVGTASIGAPDLEHCGGSCSAGTDTPPGPGAACRTDADCPNGACSVSLPRSYCTLKPNNEFHWILTGTNLGCPSDKLYDICEQRTIGATNYFCYRSQTDAGCQAQQCATRSCEATQSICNEYRDPNDPPNCRADCPLEMFQGKPQSVNERCQPQKIADGGVPGCRSYYYLKQTVEGSAGECGASVNLESGCRPFFDTSNPNRNFRGG